MTLCILGRQPELSIAELERVFGANTILEVNERAALLNMDSKKVVEKPLGGTIKIAAQLAELPTNDWPKLISYLHASLPKHIEPLPAGKLKFGLSSYGLNVKLATQQKTVLELKKTIKKSGRSIRVMPNTSHALSSAQVLNNKLTSKLGMEIILVAFGGKTLMAQTVKEQDIDAYAARDQSRPYRDARIGMLPPKLAQIMVNLAGSTPDKRLLDPFCGTGMVLQEASLMGYKVSGSDIDERMVRYTKNNLEWLKNTHNLEFDYSIEQADATNANWKKPIGAIVCETYLGRPLSSEPSTELLATMVKDCNTIISKFLSNISSQIASGTSLCIAMPAWVTKKGIIRLPLLDDLSKLHYNRQSFVHVSKDLLYYREGQHTARQLVVLTRK